MKKTLSLVIAQVFIVNTLFSSNSFAATEFIPNNFSTSPYTENERKQGVRYVGHNPSEGSTFTISASVDEVEKDGKKEAVLTPAGSKLDPASDEAVKEIYEAYRPEVLRKMFQDERKTVVKQMIGNNKLHAQGRRNQGATEDWHSTIWGHQTRRFPMETVMFFISIGLINGAMLTNDFSQNPLLMEQHLQTLVDPIGHISFYSFMLVNGYVSEFLQNRALSANVKAEFFKEHINKNMGKFTGAGTAYKFDPKDILEDSKNYADKWKTVNPYQSSVAKRAYMSMLPYLGMTAGSMASHFTGDFLRTMQSCVKSMYKEPQKGTKTETNLFGTEGENKETKIPKDRLNAISEDPCEVAWREWTLEKKFNQYSPALMSMILSTAGSGIISSQIRKFKNSAFAKGTNGTLRKGYVATFKMVGVDVTTNMLTKALGGWGTTTMKWVGHFSNITLFTALDTMIHSWVEDKVLNVNYGRYSLMPNTDAFPRKAEVLYNLLEKETKEKFSKDSSACEKDIQGRDCRVNDIEGFLYNFSETFAKWKEFNQTKALQAHSQWVDKINKFQNMERFSKTFYDRFIHDLKQSRMCKENLEACTGRYTLDQQLEMEEKNEDPFKYVGITMANYRHYPLYGIEPIADDNIDMKDWKDKYLSAPEVLQQAQQKRVHLVGATLEAYLNRRGIDSSDIKDDKKKLLEIIKGLKSADLYQNAKAIDLMRAVVHSNSKAMSEVSQSILRQHLNELGYAAPLLNYGQGFTFGFEVNSAYKDLVRDVELPEFYRHFGLSTQFRFSKKTDYLMYYMLCGPNADQNEKISENTLRGIQGFRDLFLPPRIVNDKVKLDICNDRYKFEDSSKIYSQNIVDAAGRKIYNGAFHVISQNLKPEIKQIIFSDKFDATAEEKKNRLAQLQKPLFGMDQWWEKHIEGKVSSQLEMFKRDYEEIAIKFLEAQFKGVGTLLGMPLNTDVVQNSVVAASMQESRTYSLVMGEVIKSVLTAPEYQKGMVDNKILKGLKIYKLRKKSDILTFQKAPYQQDLAAIRSGGSPIVFKFQQLNEDLLRELYNLLRNAKVVSKKDLSGVERDVVELNKNRKELEVFEKTIEEKINALEAEVAAMIELVKSSKAAKKEAAEKEAAEKVKPLRILEFGKNQLSKVARELLGTANTIRFAHNAAESYSEKDISVDDQLARAEKMKREEQKKKCHESKRMGRITSGGC